MASYADVYHQRKPACGERPSRKLEAMAGDQGQGSLVIGQHWTPRLRRQKAVTSRHRVNKTIAVERIQPTHTPPPRISIFFGVFR